MSRPIVSSLLALCVASTGCATDPQDHGPGGPGGKADAPTSESNDACREEHAGNPEVGLTNVVGCEMWEMIEERGWGDMHFDFHIFRRWWMLPARFREQLRTTLRGRGFSDPDRYIRTLPQEGDPRSGIEFCVMHGAMIQSLKNAFAPDTDRCYEGGEPIYDPIEKARQFDPACDYRYTLDGWNSDAALLGTLEEIYGVDSSQYRKAEEAITRLGDVEPFRAIGDEGLVDAQAWSAEDAWCLALQTTLRLAPIDENTPPGAQPRYVQLQQSWPGLHNSLHGMFAAGTPLASDPGEHLIDVADPSKNLKNRLFWALHGWVEFKYREARRGLQRGITEDSDLGQRRMLGTEGQCGDGHGKLWSDEWEARLQAAGSDRPAVWAEMELACGSEYIHQAQYWRNHLGIYGNPRAFADDDETSEALRSADFFHGVPAGADDPAEDEFPSTEAVDDHPSIPGT